MITRAYILILLPIVWVFVCSQQAFAQTWTGPIKIELGAEEKVFEYVRDRCSVLDLPDVYAHAIRTPDGIVLASGNAPDNYFMFGPDFSSLKRSCVPVFRSGDKWEVDSFDHQEWITSLYSDDGVTIHALVHNEYHDPYSLNCKPRITDPSNPCWYNFITYAVSHDGGRTFTQPESPNHLVAMLPFQWDADAVPRGSPPPHGYFEPSNILKHEGNYYCMMFGITSNTNQNQRGTFLLRTNDIASPGSWRIWDGEDFNIPLMNPYPNPPTDPSMYLPVPVSHNTIRGLRGSLTWNTYLNQFILIGAGVHPVDGIETCGFFLSRSNDLIHWEQPQLIRETILGWSPCNSQTSEQSERNIIQEAYPSLIDHDAPDINFTYADSTAYLYFMQNMDKHVPGGWGLRRDLVRIPIKFVKDGVTNINPENKSAKLTIYPNPANSHVSVSYAVRQLGQYRLTVYSAVGQEILVENTTFYNQGYFTIGVDMTDYPPGIYYINLTGMRTSATGKFILLK